MITEKIPTQLREKMEKLKAIGGSRETRLERLESFCIVCPLPENEQAENTQIVWIEAEGHQIICRDPGVPVSVSAAQALRYYTGFTAAFPSAISQPLGIVQPMSPVFSTIGGKMLETVWSGFNASLLTYGQSGTGKTSHAMALLEHFLHGLFDLIDATSDRKYAVGVSAWEIKGETHRDLLETGLMKERREEKSHQSTQPSAVDFVCVSCPNLKAAKAVIAQAQKASLNFSFPQDFKEAPSPQRNRSHLFMRVVVHCSQNNRLSTLHLVDLAGFAGANSGKEDGIEWDPAEKGLLQKQIHAVSKVISELATLQKCNGKRAGSPVQTLVSARDHVLTKGLVPLLTGNSKTYLLACLKSGDQDYQSSLNTLHLVQQAGLLETACVSCAGVQLEDLDLKPLSLVLPHLGPPKEKEEPNDATEPSSASLLLKRIDSSLSDINRMKEKEIEQKIQRESPRIALDLPPEPELGGDAWLKDYEDSRREVLEKMERFQKEDDKSLLGDIQPANSESSAVVSDLLPTAPSSFTLVGQDVEQKDEEGAHSPQANSLNNLRNEIHSIFEKIAYNKSQNEGSVSATKEQMNGKPRTALVDVIKDLKSNGSELMSPKSLGGSQHTLGSISGNAFSFATTKASREERNRLMSLDDSADDNDKAWLEKEGEGGDDFPYPSTPNQGDAPTSVAPASTPYGTNLDTISPKVTRAVAQVIPSYVPNPRSAFRSRHSSTESEETVVTVISKGNIDRFRNTKDPSKKRGLQRETSQRLQVVLEGSDEDLSQRQSSSPNVKVMNESYKQLLQILEEERQMRSQIEEKTRDVEHTMLEAVTQYEIQVDNLRLENNKLSSKLRKMEKKSNMAEVFQQFEEDLKRLHAECEKLRAKNAELSMKQFKTMGQLGDDGHHPLLLEKQSKIISKLQNDNKKLQQENFELRKKSRESILNARLADSAHNKANKLSRQIQYKDNELQSTRQNSAQAEGRIQKMEAEYTRAIKNEKQMREELERALHELSIYKNRTHELQEYQRKNGMLKRFVDNHTNPNRHNGNSKKEPARLKEALASLSVSVRRSQPSLLPMVTEAQKALTEEIEEGDAFRNLSAASMLSS